MSKNRESSITTEHSTSSMPGYPIVKLEGDGAALLFEDNSTVVEEPTSTEGTVKEEHGVKDEDTGASVGVPSTSRSSSTDMKPSPSPGLGGGDDRSPATPIIGPKPKIKVEKAGPQLIGDLPRAEEAAMRTFVEIQENHYQYGTLGRSREALESMNCDCQYEHGVDDPDEACGHDSDCINRLTQVECLPDDCKCRGYCRNQRFQRRQYAPIEIVQTEKKGFGLRAGANLRKDTFIYEYVGDVVSQPSFLKRMRQYAEEGIRHFYFMMLQKDEFIDATKRGGIGRFANHSCKPNCYVAKWTIGNKVRMGIFAHRNIQKYEELTFNYNVDRYGHDAQPCYCGEAKCVGFIGGKTQTDLAAMDDLYLDALGITDEVEQLGLKGSKKKRSKKLDEDFIPDLKPLLLKDVPKVVQAMRQTQSRKVLVKLLTRIKLTEDQSALRQIMRLRGFSVMTNILEDYAKDIETCVLALECMMTWPLIQRNKVEDSKVNVPVKVCSESDNQVLAELAKKLLEQWETLEFAYRIPKRQKTDGNEDDPQDTSPVEVVEEEDWRPLKRSKRSGTPEGAFTWAPAPMSSERLAELDRIAEQTRASEALMRKAREDKEARERDSFKKQKDDIAAIIAAATAATEAAALAPAVPSPSGDHRSNGSHKKRSSKSKKLSAEEKEANKEKRLLKLVGAVVVKVMSKYQKEMDSDSFKRHAKELTQVIAEKEKKTSSYKDSRLDALSDEKVAKIKKFAKEYIAKILRKLDKAGQRHKSSSSAPSSSMSASTSTAHMSSNGHSHANDLHDVDIPTAMDSMDLDDRWDDGWGEPSPMGESHRSSPTTPKHVVDPRVRHRKEESGWDPSYDSKDTFTGVQPYEEDAFDDDLRLR